MQGYFYYVKKHYLEEKDFIKSLGGIDAFLIFGVAVTGENLKLLLLFGIMSVIYIFGLPFMTYWSKRKDYIVEHKKEYIKKEFLAEEFGVIDFRLFMVEEYDNANKVGALIESGKKLSEEELAQSLKEHEEYFEESIIRIDEFYYKNGKNKENGYIYHGLNKNEFIKRKAYIEKRIEAIDNPAINRARIVGKEWLQLIISVFGGYALGKFDAVLSQGNIFMAFTFMLIMAICVVFMIISSIFSKQSFKNDNISYYTVKDILNYEKDILCDLIMTWKISDRMIYL